MQTNQNNQNNQEKDNNPGKPVSNAGYKEDNYPYNKIADQHPLERSVKYIQPASDSASNGQKNTEGTPYDEIEEYQLTDDQLTDENGHGNTL